LTTPVTRGSTFSAVNIDTTTSYYVTETNAALCVSPTTIVIATINKIPTAPIGIDSSRCGPGVVVLGATPSASPTDTIKWYSDAGLTTPVNTGTNYITPDISQPVTPYYITETSSAGCTSTTSTTVTATIIPQPVVAFSPLAPVCQEAPNFNLTGGSEINGPTGSTGGSYSGNGVIGDSAFSPQQAGPGTFPIVYTYTAANGCFDTAIQDITVYPTPSVDYGGVQSVLQGDSLTLVQTSVSGIGLQYLWTPAAYLSSDTIATPLCLPVDSITYNITVTSPGGCHASTTLLVQVLKDFDVPNTFTPNGDGINDTWVIQNLPQFPIQWVQVFDRYGQLLYESHGYSTPWDGTYKGHQLPAGTYYYIIELGGVIAPKTGYVTILR